MVAIAHPVLDPIDFVALQADASWTLPVEFIGGEAVVMPPSGGHAASAQGELFYALRRWQAATGDGGLLLQDVFVSFHGSQYISPDIAWWSAVRRPALRDGAVDVIPDLVVEVLSPKTRANDLGVKRDLYVASEIRELWLADPPAKTLTRVVPGRTDSILGVQDTISSELLRDFKLPIAEIFAV